MSDNQLIRSSSIMAIGTITSRFTGLIRNLLLVALLGTALLGDTYNVANTMPNILYNLLIGGALTIRLLITGAHIIGPNLPLAFAIWPSKANKPKKNIWGKQ